MKKLLYILSLVTMMLTAAFACSAGDAAGKVVTSGGNLNVRSEPSSASAVITSVKNSSWLTVKEKKGDWYKAEYADGKFGWLSSKYIRYYSDTYEMQVAVSSGRLNVRSGSSTEKPVIDTLNKGDSVVILYGNSKWSRILYSGNKIGYAATPYLKAPAENKYESVKMNVPYYSQTDSRWSSYPIGSYGDNIGTIGCTTTALAMIESYHTETAVTPDKMAARLSYSASGSLYWPQWCSVENADTNYLSRIYNILKSGRPVVFGAKKANGSQHWVAVTGYTGGNTFSASDFIINDPGSTKRIRLSDFLAVYPNAYRIVFRK